MPGWCSMETLHDYLARKRREIGLLNGRLDHPIDLPEPFGIDDVMTVKERIRASQLAGAIVTHPHISDTNGWEKLEHPFHEYRLRYLYQRYNLEVLAPPIYPDSAKLGQGHDTSAVTTRYVASGMSALASILLALNRIVANGCHLLAMHDTFFETQHLIRQLAPNLHLRLACSPEEMMAQIGMVAGGEEGLALLIDSIVAADPIPMLERIAAGAIDLLIVDTTCYEVASPGIERAIDAALRLGIPLVLVRSHLKLDFMGVEYGRLGSVVTLLGPDAPDDVRRLYDALVAVSHDVTCVLGMAAVPYNLIPGFDDPAFHALNNERIDRLRNNNAWGSDHVRRALFLHGFNVVSYHHQLFFTVELASGESHEEVKEKVEDLQRHLYARRLPVRRATSFGFDFVAVADFVDLNRDAPVIRVALSDHSRDIVEEICDQLVEWCLASRNEAHRSLQQAGSGR